MKRFFSNEKIDVESNVEIEGIEHNHIKNVMRMSIGDELILVCGNEYDYYAKIIDISKGTTKLFVYDKKLNEFNPKKKLTVFQALVKTDNMSLIVQKLTELGVSNFVPFESEFITSKDKFGKVNKLQEVSNQSIKQCKRSIPMQICEIQSFKKVCEMLSQYDIVIFANETEDKINLKDLDFSHFENIAIIVGSEGGFSENEIQLLNEVGAKSVSLGKRILRAETASISLASVVMYEMGEWNYV